MTNAEIILGEQLRLVEEGVLNYTGRMITGISPLTGEEVEIPEIQPIHTYNGWKSLGYQVKKGEKAVTKFAIWKYLTKKKKEEEADEESKEKVTGKCYMKTAAFFTNEQVEKIKEDN